jgi:hypothetical protein
VTGHVYESGLGPLAAGVVNVVLNAGATGVAIWALTPDDEDLVKAAAAGDPDCEALDPLTPGARAQALKNLDTWEDAARAKFSGPRLGAALKTIANLRELLKKDADAEGTPVGQCHVRAAFSIVDRQFAQLSKIGTSSSAKETSSSTAEDARTPATSWAWTAPATVAVVASAALAAFYAWRRTR